MSNFLFKVYKIIWTIFAINYWYHQSDDHPYNKEFDEWCLQSLKDGKRFDVDNHRSHLNYTCVFNGRVLWIENHPFASFHLYEKGFTEVSPSRYTRYLLNKKFNEDKKNHLHKQIKWK